MTAPTTTTSAQLDQGVEEGLGAGDLHPGEVLELGHGDDDCGSGRVADQCRMGQQVGDPSGAGGAEQEVGGTDEQGQQSGGLQVLRGPLLRDRGAGRHAGTGGATGCSAPVVPTSNS
jgi:hypothetical protein